jgi:hypothetical protein
MNEAIMLNQAAMAPAPSSSSVLLSSVVCVEMGWPDIHWLAWDKGGLVAAVFEFSMS